MKPNGNSKIELLEKELRNNPESATLMEDLLWEYFQNPSLQGHPNRISLIKSYIKRYPTTTTAKSPIVQINPKTSFEGYQSLEKEWLNLLSRNSDHAEITRSVANFYSLANPEKALDILQKYISKDPTKGDIWLDLGRYCTNADERLVYFQEARKRDAKQPNLLVWIARVAVDAKNFSTAEYIGLELLSLVDEARSKFGEKLDWKETGQDLWARALEATRDKNAARDLVSEISAHSYHKHWGHTALGHVALSNSDITTAIEHLMKSCEVVSDPRLSSYGPSLTLADELCKYGAWAEVENYLMICKSFWKNDSIETWLKQVKNKEFPNFNNK